MRAVKTLLSIACLLAFTAVPAHAQDSQDSQGDSMPPLLRFVANNETFEKQVLKKAYEIYQQQFAECTAKPDKTIRQVPTPYLVTVFPPAETTVFSPPSAGQWGEHVVIQACGQNRQVNMLAVAQQGGQMPVLFATLPGNTRSDPASQPDTRRLAMSSIRKYDPECAAEPRILNTYLVGYRSAEGKMAAADAGEGWFEQWRFAYCENVYPAQLAFLPKAGGGYDIRVQIAKAQPLAAEAGGAKPAAAPAASASPAVTQNPPPAAR